MIGPLPSSTPHDLDRSRDHQRGVPVDLLRDASHRLAIGSLLAAVLWVVGPVLGHAADWALSQGAVPFSQLRISDAIAAASVLVSLTLFLYVRASDRDPAFILDLGLGYMVLTSLALGMSSHWDASGGGPIRPMISWVGVVVIIFAAIVPSSPRKTLVAGLVAASMNPLSMLIFPAHGGWDLGATRNALLMHYNDYVLVGVAIVISHVVTNLGRQVGRAREMGSYRLGDLLGRGGMGEVYRATHRMLARPAAIKLIRPEMLGAADGEAAKLAVKRFRREAEAAANLRSSHTVALYDFGVAEDRTLYFVMELLDGLDLETLVRESGPLPSNRVIHIVCQVCDSLEEAHAAGLVHRDIKPANIHLGRVGLRHDFVKVLDFGLVKPVAEASTGHSLATEVGVTPGTPAYMAPEMALGETVDGRSDIYALGCVAYFLLTGQLVFDSENSYQLIAKHLNAQPVPPSQRSELTIPPELDEVVLACLEKDPRDRPQTATALARLLAAIPVERWSEEQATKWWTVNRLAKEASALPTAPG
ncbi:MAG: serine/threonine protein kinase [Gemmatimonadota bacterium]|nr:serine/threonine protein kinase [Gemmatimonadota bacterium]